MNVLIIIGIVLFSLVVALLTWIGVPGTFIISFFVLLCGWLSGFTSVTFTHFAFILVIAIVLEGVEFFMGGLAARYYGASRRSAIFAIIGGIIGTIIGAGIIIPIGALIGLLVGSYTGAYMSEKFSGKSNADSARAALGAVLGNIASKALKSTAVMVIGIWLAVTLT